jgi:dTDP-4-amino-4,6-dideoxygalactose transaminase
MIDEHFSSWPSFSDEEAQAVYDVLLSNKVNYWTGNEGRMFEKEFAEFVGCDHAVALANGTVALDLAFKAIGLGKGDEVVVTSRTFLASVSSIINSGATPIFADVDFASQNVTVDTISEVITNRTKAIVCVHLAGWPCDMDPIMELARVHNYYVIEDCAQAHGAQYKGRSVGSIGHVGCWSFCQDKIMTTGGEGGMVTTNDKMLWSKMWSFKDHGKSWDAVYEREHPPGYRWLHESFGTNWRMTEMQSVIGRIQLKKLSAWQELRIKFAEQIWSAARDNNKLLVPELGCSGCSNPNGSCVGCKHAAYKCYVLFNGTKAKRDAAIIAVNERGVPCNSGSCSEVYREKAFDNTDFRPRERLPTAKRLGEQSLMFLCHPTLSQDEVDKTCEVIKNVIK